MEFLKQEKNSKENFVEENNVGKIEAIFFIAGRFLDINELVAISDLNPDIIIESIKILQSKYSLNNSAIQIVERENMWKMDVKKDYSYIVNRLATGSSEFSGAEQETLAIIAFKQPIKQSIVIKMRGNKAYDHIKKFVDLGLINKRKMGHTYELDLNKEFYDYFNLSEKEKEKKCSNS